MNPGKGVQADYLTAPPPPPQLGLARAPGNALEIPLPPDSTVPSHTGDAGVAPPHAPILADPSTWRLTGTGFG